MTKAATALLAAAITAAIDTGTAGAATSELRRYLQSREVTEVGDLRRRRMRVVKVLRRENVIPVR